MKPLAKYILTFGILIIGTLTLQAQVQRGGAEVRKDMNEAESYLKHGDARNLARFFNETIEINIEGKKQNYSRTQAEFVIKDFFSKNPPIPESFESYHKGQSAGLSYSIMKYASSNGNYRVFLKIKSTPQGRNIIDAIDFTRE
ncbi:MAG: DUF4783 domain-containing protein [Raineya sp.]|nr:DUF4783 domain-containing protein [Raineya sp.]MDW8296049.1 DUF4783 domain-containing protein [Raineya sp.]